MSTAERDAYLSWSAFGARIADSNFSEEGRIAGQWATEVLAPLLGDGWLRGVTDREGSVPEEILNAHFHVIALAELLELALRFRLLADVEGIGDVRRDLAADLRVERRLHTRAVLGLAGFAQRLEWPVAIEKRLEPSRPPTDLVVTLHSGAVVGAEVFIIFTDELMRANMADTNSLMQRVRALCWGNGVQLDGEFKGGSDDDAEEWFAEVEEASERASVESSVQIVDHLVGRVEVIPDRLVHTRERISFNGPRMSGREEWRLPSILRKKAAQAVKAGAGWVVTEVMDGLWQFTDWAGLPLSEKGENLAVHVRSALDGLEGIHGAVLSCGPAMAQGAFVGESARLARGGYVLRRPFDPIRVRETIIVPVTSDGEAEAARWCELYDGEERWLDWALTTAEHAPMSCLLRFQE